MNTMSDGKTLGASESKILRLFLWDFSKPIVAANVVAWPLAFVAVQIYLNFFVSRATLTPLLFAYATTGP